MLTLLLTITSISQTVAAPIIDIHEWALPTYGSEITFDIMRKGKNIGTHEVTFEKSEDQLVVEAKTEIRVKFLFFNAYKFDYSAREVWENGKLMSLHSLTNDNGKRSKVDLTYGTGFVSVINNDEDFTNSLEGSIFTTNHWNPNVLSQKSVLNTMTGRTNTVEISEVGKEMVRTGANKREAMRHEYDGDLTDVFTWYDEKKRWVGLDFKSKDGSVISYECNSCGEE